MKKAISPLIGAILIIGFTIALAAVVMFWSSGFIKSTTTTTGEKVTEQVTLLRDLEMKVRDATTNLTDSTIKVKVENKNEKKIEGFIVKLYGSDGTFTNDSIDVSLEPFEIKYIIVGYDSSIGNITKIEVIPKVIVDQEEIAATLQSDEFIAPAITGAAPTGEYSSDANTVLLFHFDKDAADEGDAKEYSYGPAMVGWYHFNGDATDSSGNGNDGTINGATQTTGKFSNAYEFDGTNDFINITDSSSLDITSDLTIEAWINPDSVTTDNVHILYKSGVSYGFGINKSGYLMFWGNDKTVSNEGFEAGTTNPTGWNGYTTTGDKRTTSQYHSGSAAGRLEDTSGAGSGSLVSPAINFEKGKTYKISYWYKPTGSVTTTRMHMHDAVTWINTESGSDKTYTGLTPDVWQEVVFYYTNTNTSFKYLYIGNGPASTTGTVYFDDVSVRDVVTGTELIPTSTFTHTAVVFDDSANQVKFYKNGILDITRSFTDSIGTDNEDLLIGKSVSSHYFDGTIDEVALYDRTLFATEIKQHAGILAKDYSSFGNNGTITEATWTESGKFSSALSFDGNEDYITVIDDSSLDITEEITIEAWVKINTIQNWMRIFVWNDGTKTMQFGFNDNTQKLTVHSYNGATSTAKRMTTTFPTGVWKHVVFIDDSGTQSIYVDGILQSLEVSGAFSNPLNTGVYIGRWPDGGTTEWFNGTIDEVRISNIARTF